MLLFCCIASQVLGQLSRFLTPTQNKGEEKTEQMDGSATEKKLRRSAIGKGFMQMWLEMPENALGEKKRNERRESMSLKSRALKSAIALKFGKYARRFKIKLFEIFFFESANLLKTLTYSTGLYCHLKLCTIPQDLMLCCKHFVQIIPIDLFPIPSISYCEKNSSCRMKRIVRIALLLLNTFQIFTIDVADSPCPQVR